MKRGRRNGGLVVFSAGHSIADYHHFDPDDYFETEEVSAKWVRFGDSVEVPTYRRPLGATLNPILDAGFRLEQIAEAEPTDRFHEKDLDTYERVSREHDVSERPGTNDLTR